MSSGATVELTPFATLWPAHSWVVSSCSGSSRGNRGIRILEKGWKRAGSQRREEKRGSDHRRGRALWVCLWVCLPILLLGLAYYYQLPQEQELQRLHRHAVDVTLDPNTAAPKLILSEDGKQVRHGDKRQALPDNPERFDLSPCVLGKEGFSSGRHYWEVEVGEKTDWDLGVARESISRKGQITLSPEDGYWTVWLRIGNEYEALDDPSVLLPLSLKPRTGGVFVDYEGGQVSFYNVEARSHIYTFTVVCTDAPSVARVEELLDGFCRATGAAVNKAKSDVYLSRAWPPTVFPVKPFIKVLVITIDGTNTVKQALWEGRNISLFNMQELDPVVIARRGMILVRDYINLEVHQRGKEEAFKNWQIQDLGELRIP
ncbi:uncharacterized protein LOC136767308 [Amia ocellicauda]|uniref:uncharacterized protein LOC136767308 n=1 Tax=Amia ocellicauda TaxID=2972642 RepID=UPI0034643626